MIPTPKFNNRFPVKKYKRAKVRKSISSRIRPGSLIKQRLTIDCGDFVSVRNEGQNKVGFGGYRFLDDTSDDLKWNDGVFWSYTNNFSELPVSAYKTSIDYNDAGSLIGTFNEPVEPGTTNFLSQNKRIVGGSLVLYNPNPTDADAQFYSSTTKDPTVNVQGYQAPVIGLTGTTRVHQYDQKIDISEDMVFTKVASVPSGQSNFQQLTTILPNPVCQVFNQADGNETREFTVAQTRLIDAMRFKVRNICILLPHNLVNDGSATDYGALEQPFKKKEIEDKIMSEIFQKTEYGFGPPQGDNSDLRRRINPKFKVIRDWTGTYAFSGRGAPRTVKSRFYHRYNHNIPTMCNLDNQVDTLFSTQFGGADLPGSMTILTDVQVPDESETAPATGEGRTIPVGTKRQRTDLEEGENVSGGFGFILSSDFDASTLRNYNPQTHRLVWLRFPRFAGNMELTDINKGIFTPSEFVSIPEFKSALANCGTRLRGYSEWNMLKPEVTATGGTTSIIKVDHQDAAGVSSGYSRIDPGLDMGDVDN
jgi:hypothetical protein